MSEQGGTVDPRFDPRFQRGYDPAVHAVPSPEPELSPEPDPIPEVAAFAPVARAEAPARADGFEQLGLVGALPVEERAPRRTNPYRVALGVASVALLVLGVVMIVVALQPRNDSVSDVTTAVWLSQLTQYGPLLALGPLLAGLIGLLLWVALSAIAPRSPLDEDEGA